MAGATASTSLVTLGGTGSAAQAGATGSNGGTTVGTLACSSCCGPQGRYLVGLFGGYGYTGLCPGAIDNSKPFGFYASLVLTFTAPYTSAQFCVPTSFSVALTAFDYLTAQPAQISVCPSDITPPATRVGWPSSYGNQGGNLWYFAPYPGALYGNNDFFGGSVLCVCALGFPFNVLSVGGFGLITVVSCSPAVFSTSGLIYEINLWTGAFTQVGTVAITLTF